MNLDKLKQTVSILVDGGHVDDYHRAVGDFCQKAAELLAVVEQALYIIREGKAEEYNEDINKLDELLNNLE